jgi:hypothetical protein
MMAPLPNFIQLIQVFLGPVATLIAAGVAAYFVRAQWRTAERQAETAIDQLRWNLFSKRYAIYEAAKKSIELALERCDEDHMPNDLGDLFFQFEEARFFFPNDTSLFLDTLRKDIKKYLARNYAHRQNKTQTDVVENVERRQKLLDEEATLLNLRQELYSTRINLPKIFGSVLNFPQLTGRAVTR